MAWPGLRPVQISDLSNVIYKKKSSLKLLNELYANFSGTLFEMFYRKMPNFCLISQTRIYRDNSNFWIISETFWPLVEAKKVPFCSDLSNNMLPEAIEVSDYSNTKNLWNSKFKWFVRFCKFLLGYVVLSLEIPHFGLSKKKWLPCAILVAERLNHLTDL